MSIKSFDELYDKIGGICTSNINFKINSQDAHLSFNDLSNKFIVTLPEKKFESKDPQKIYNVIKAIKECEDE